MQYSWCCGCGGRQAGLRQRSRLFMVVRLVSQYRACQVASPSWTDRQTGNVPVWPSTSTAVLVPDHVTGGVPHVTQWARARLSLTRTVLLSTQCFLISSSVELMIFFRLFSCWLVALSCLDQVVFVSFAYYMHSASRQLLG